MFVFVQFMVQGLRRAQFTSQDDRTARLIVNSLAILVASIPIALPIVMQVTMAIGIRDLATTHRAVVTSVPALQDVASMSILCSDKTGTLTTAKITIVEDRVVTTEGWKKEDVLLYASAAANADKLGDPIDSAILRARASPCKSDGWVQDRLVGFTPVVKRTLAYCTTKDGEKVLIAKGILSKIIDTSNGGEDDAEVQWKVKEPQEVCDVIADADFELSKAGYKTIAIAVSKDGGKTMSLVGVLPMLDPPREDTKKTIEFLHKANVSVKMITGDHRNIAIETGRLIDLGTDIHAADECRDDTQEVRDVIWNADGFAQVLPSDKRHVVQVLRHDFGCVIGMTGDGVNDAPALSAAQVGVAVEGATDAAKNAAAIILTDPGLSPIFGAVCMSREIFRKVKSYVVYRLSCSIFIVLTLCILIYISACTVESLLIILLALLNDISMLPIAHDKVAASRNPEIPKVKDIIIRALFFGMVSTAIGMLYFYTINPMSNNTKNGLYEEPFYNIYFPPFFCSTETSALVWLYLTILSESLIFTVRVPHNWFWTKPYPSPWLLGSVFLTDMLFTLIAGFLKGMHVVDILITWAFALGSFVFVDAMKMLFFIKILGEDGGETISFEEFKAAISDGADPSDPPSDDAVEGGDAQFERVAAKERRLSHHLRHTLEGDDRHGHEEVEHERSGLCSWVRLHVARKHRAHFFHTHRDHANMQGHGGQ